MKKCSVCGKEKELTLFGKHKGYKDGYRSECNLCKAEWNRGYYKKNKLRIRKLHREYSKKWRQKPEIKLWHREYLLRKKFGITIDKYNVLLEKQKGVCAICSGKGNKRKLFVDHCHKSGKIRGLLCSKCNSGIGMFNDDNILLKRAILYLSFKEQETREQL